MEIYLVGGAVRDKLLGYPPRDLDYVVIGSTPDEMMKLGFQPVGKSFEVFLHPENKAQYSLARELSDDLGRRDLTINAMAMNDKGDVIDPFHGRVDLKKKLLKHVSEKNFFDDPLRVFRVARFKCQYPEFTIDEGTLDLMRRVPTKDVTPERIFKEFQAALSTPRPSLFFEVLKSVGALEPYFKNAQLSLIDKVSSITRDLSIRFASLKLVTPLPLPNDWPEAARVTERFLDKAIGIFSMEAEDLVTMLYQMDGFRKPHLIDVLAVILQSLDHPDQADYLQESFSAVRMISSKDLPPTIQGVEMGEAIRRKRTELLKSMCKL